VRARNLFAHCCYGTVAKRHRNAGDQCLTLRRRLNADDHRGYKFAACQRDLRADAPTCTDQSGHAIALCADQLCGASERCNREASSVRISTKVGLNTS
jgi:hypothetical protein